MTVKTRKVHTWCDQCETPIYVDDQMWFKGSEFYCQISCLADSFNVRKPKAEERDLLLREKRIEMMKSIHNKWEGRGSDFTESVEKK